jgi:DNA-binding NtrC family response regulator
MDLIGACADDLDVVLLDVTLPGVSSREILEQAGRIRPGLKVILTSAYSKESVSHSFAGLPVERFIRKPFQVAHLERLLRDALSA